MRIYLCKLCGGRAGDTTGGNRLNGGGCKLFTEEGGRLDIRAAELASPGNIFAGCPRMIASDRAFCRFVSHGKNMLLLPQLFTPLVVLLLVEVDAAAPPEDVPDNNADLYSLSQPDTDDAAELVGGELTVFGEIPGLDEMLAGLELLSPWVGDVVGS